MDVKKKGFTLIELIVVITIIGILTTISAVVIMNMRAQRNVKAAAEQVRNLILEAHSYAISPKNINNYPGIKVDLVVSSGRDASGNLIEQFVRVSQRFTVGESEANQTSVVDKGFSKSIRINCTPNPCIRFEASDANTIGQTPSVNNDITVSDLAGNETYKIVTDKITGNVTITKVTTP